MRSKIYSLFFRRSEIFITDSLNRTKNNHSLMVRRLAGLRIFVEMFQIQVLSENISDDKSESLYKTVWLVDQILIHNKIF
jgi:hypothetical protein